MNTIISNKIFIERPTQAVYLLVKDELTMPNPTYTTLLKIGKEDLIRYKHLKPTMNLFVERGLDLEVPFGFLPKLWNYIKDCPYQLGFNDHGIVMNQSEHIKTPLYNYQEEAVNKMLQNKMGVLVACCSAGKTNIMIELLHRIGKRFLFLVHTKDLLKQFYDRAKSLYPSWDIGVISEGDYKVGDTGAVGTIQTMAMLDKELYRHDFDVVVCDECAHVTGSPTLSKMFFKVVSSIYARHKFGCTATPKNSTNTIKSMYAILGCNANGDFAPVYEIDKSKTNTLTAKHIKIDSDIPFTYSVLNSDGTFDYNTLINHLSSDNKRNDLIISKAIECIKDKRKTILLTHRVEHASNLCNALQEKGIKAVLLVGKVSSKRRNEILGGKVEFDCICATYSLLKEGIDLPILSAEILCTPLSDESMTIQCCGRIERVCENKPEPILLDIVDINYPYCLGKYKKRARILRNRR